MHKNPEFLNQEIAELERKLAAKRETLSGKESVPEEKEVFTEVFREHSEYQGGVESPSPAASDTSSASGTRRPLSAEEEEKVSSLIEHSFHKGVSSAVSEARKFNDAYLLDHFHDKLIDEYYQKLIQARKIVA